MKQKYTIVNEKESGKLMIQEYAELDKDVFSLVCEETYDTKDIKSVASDGKLKLISKLRTPNLYPIAEYADKIADAVMGFFDKKTATDSPVELVFDDIKIMRHEEKVSDDDEPSGEEIDDLLDEDDEDLDDTSDSDDTEEDDDLDMFDDEENEE